MAKENFGHYLISLISFNYLFVGEFFSQRGEEMPQFGGSDESVSVLVEVPQALDEVLGGVRRTARANGLGN